VGQINAASQIPKKTYFKIGEVCDLTGIKTHTLRYWETEFKVIRPHRAGSKQRLYRRVDLENILKIKKLIYEDGHTIAGTRKYLANERKQKTVTKSIVKTKTDNSIIKKIKTELNDIKKILEQK